MQLTNAGLLSIVLNIPPPASAELPLNVTFVSVGLLYLLL